MESDSREQRYNALAISKRALGKDEIRRFRLAQIQIRGVGDVAHVEKAIERLGVIDVSHIHHQTANLAVWLAEWVAQRRAS
jgi:tRNA A37 threonylcarbamoyladenosine dehydratase